MKQVLLFIGLLSLFCSCRNKESEVLFISHTRLCTGEGPDKVDPRIEGIDFSHFEMIIHGGDVLCETSKYPERLAYTDSVFHVKSENTLWVKGNHDDDNLKELGSFTGQEKPWQLKTIGNTHFLVLDYFMKSNEFSSQEYIPVLDELPLKSGDNLVILTHYLYWLYEHPEMMGLDTLVSNVRVCEEYDWCLKPNDFMSLVYPELRGFEENGIEVFCVAGDMGAKRRTFHYSDSQGVTFIGNGVNNQSLKDSVLVFTGFNSQLKWQFKPLSGLKGL